jgi:hypothetical protein
MKIAYAALCALVGFTAASLHAEEQTKQVELFSGIQNGDIDVRLIPKDAKVANVLIQNNTDRPLAIRLPDAFAGVPAAVLAQFQPPFAQNNLFGQNQNGGNQAVGGPLNQGIFNVGPGKLRKLTVPVVCLQHGKADPHPRVEYTIQPLDSMTDNPNMAKMLTLLGDGEISQQTAQAVSWHYMDGMRFEALARKVGARHLNGSVEPFFSSSQLELAEKLCASLEKKKDGTAVTSLGRNQ